MYNLSNDTKIIVMGRSYRHLLFCVCYPSYSMMMSMTLFPYSTFVDERSALFIRHIKCVNRLMFIRVDIGKVLQFCLY